MLAYGTWAKQKTQEYTSDEFFLGGFRRVRLFFKLTCDRVAIFLIIWFYYRNLCYIMTILNLWFAAVETERNTAIGPRWVCGWELWTAAPPPGCCWSHTLAPNDGSRRVSSIFIRVNALRHIGVILGEYTLGNISNHIDQLLSVAKLSLHAVQIFKCSVKVILSMSDIHLSTYQEKNMD